MKENVLPHEKIEKNDHHDKNSQRHRKYKEKRKNSTHDRTRTGM